MVKNTNLLNDICCRCTLELPHRVTYVTENKEIIFKVTLKPSIMSIVFASFKQLKNCQSVL